MKNVFKVVSVVMALAMLVGIMAATGLLASADEPTAISTWKDTNGVAYTYVWNGVAYANVYSYTAGTPSAWGEFAAGIADVEENQFVEVVLTGSFVGAAAENVSAKSRVWQETGEKTFAVSANENEVVFRIQGPLTFAAPADGNIDVTFGSNMTGISEAGDTHMTVTLYEGTMPKPTEDPTEEPTEEPTATGAEPTEEPTGTEPVVTEPSESQPSESEPVVTEPSETKPSTPVVLLYGDANADNEINMKDVLTLRKHLAGMKVEINMALADANGDDEVNMKDVLALRKYLAGMDQVLGK